MEQLIPHMKRKLTELECMVRDDPFVKEVRRFVKAYTSESILSPAMLTRVRRFVMVEEKKRTWADEQFAASHSGSYAQECHNLNELE